MLVSEIALSHGLSLDNFLSRLLLKVESLSIYQV